MKKPIKKPTFHKLLAWISLALNIEILSIIRAITFNRLYIAIIGTVVGILCFLRGLNKISGDVVVNDYSNASVWITYIGTFGLSCVTLFFDEVPSLATWVMIPLLLIEALIAILIARKRGE